MTLDGLVSEDIWIWALRGYDGDVSIIRILHESLGIIDVHA